MRGEKEAMHRRKPRHRSRWYMDEDDVERVTGPRGVPDSLSSREVAWRSAELGRELGIPEVSE